MSEKTDSIPDPLLEQFEELQRGVAARELLVKQATCTHPYPMAMFGRRERFCSECGAMFDPEAPRFLPNG